MFQRESANDARHASFDNQHRLTQAVYIRYVVGQRHQDLLTFLVIIACSCVAKLGHDTISVCTTCLLDYWVSTVTWPSWPLPEPAVVRGSPQVLHQL